MARNRRHWALGTVTLAVLALGTWQYLRWKEAHRPRPFVYEEIQKVGVSWSAPAIQRSWDEKALVPTPFLVSFSLPSAPMDKVGKEPGPGISMSPQIPGRWQWSDSQTLVFTPLAPHWVPGTAYTVSIDPEELAPKRDYSKNKLEFTTRPLGAELRDFNFYTSPKDPSVHQLVGEARFTHPVELEEVGRHIALEVVGNMPIFASGPQDQPLFTVTQGEGPRQFFIRSRNIGIPEKEDFVRLRITKGVNSAAYGKPLEQEPEVKTRVPDKFSGFHLTAADTRIIRNEEGDPEQMLFVHSDKDIDSEEVAKRIGAWWSDQGWDMQDRAKMEQQLTAAPRIKLVPVPSEAPLSQRHSFRFTEPRPGTMLLRVEPGVKAPGGFETGKEFEHTAEVPPFPREVEILGKGNILSLGGAKKLVASSRGMGHLQVSFGRVPVSQVQHIISQNRNGDFANPDIETGYFSERSVVQRYRKIVPVPLQNDWEAVQTEIDLNEAPPMTTPDVLPGGRGIFFVRIEPVRKVEPEEPDNSVFGRIESPRDDDEEGDGYARGYNSWEDSEGDTTGFPDGWEEDKGEGAARFVMVTDLGMMVKLGADGARDVFVMSLGAGVPVEGVNLKALARNGTVLLEATTDAEGRAKFPPLDGFTKEREPIALLASKAEDITFLPLKESQLPAMDYSRFDIDGVVASRQKAVEGFLFTERGIYRPGDAVNAAALVRRRDWEPVLEGLPVRLTLTDSQGRQVAQERLRMPYDGFLEAKFAIPESAPLGSYEIAALVLNSKDEPMFRLGRTQVKVEEFQPDRSKVTAAIEPAPPVGWMKPEPATARAEVHSLFGDAAVERRVTMQVTLSPSDFRFPAWEGFTFHDRAAERSASQAGRVIDLGEAKTGEDGKAEFKLPLETLKDASYRMAITTEAFEREGGRSVRHTFTQMVSPWDEVLGWKADGDLDYIGKNAGRSVKMVAIDRTLASVARPKLHRRLIEIRQVSALTQHKNGNYSYVSTRHERVAAMADLALAAGGSDLTLATGEPGNFRLEIIDDEDAVLCVIPYRVAGKGDKDRSLEREAELELVLSRGEVRPGEEVEIHLTAPYAGAGVVTLERDRVLVHQWFRTETNQTTVKLRVPPDIDGTVYVNAAFLRSTTSPEVFHSPLSYAAAPLRVTPLRRQMEVTLDTPKVIRPGTEAKFGFTASKESRLVLYAVDEGIHQITSYKLPRPLDYFTRKQALEVRTLQWLDLLLPEYQFMKAAPAFGGDGDGDLLSLHVNPFKRRQEAPVVFWSGLVAAGPERREVTWQVPDYFNGNLRVMAVAANAGGVGTAESSSLVKAPIIMVPNTPLFVSPGDEFEASLAVTNNLETPGMASISVDASGTSQLEPVGNAIASVELEPGKEGMLHFRFKAKDDLGAAELKFTATGGNETIVRTTTLSVRPATHFLTKVQSGWFRTGSQEVEMGRTLYPQFRRGEAVASVLPMGLAKGLEAYVSGFPHGCSEQITSKAMVKLLVSTEADFGLPPAVAAEHLRGAIALLANRQQSDGGFGYWYAGAPRTFDFHSLYVLHFLTEAKLLGHAVPERMMKGALDYATATARADINGPDQAELQAYAIYLLARNGETAPFLLNLRDTLTKTQAGKWEGRSTAAWMAATYHLLKQDDEAEALMKTCVETRKKSPPKSPNSYYYNSDEAEALKIFYIRCRHFPKQAKDFGYDDLDPVMAPLRKESFTTLTASFMTLALKAYGDLAGQTALELTIRAKPRGGSESVIAGPAQGLVRGEFAEGTSEISFLRDQKGGGDIGAFYQSVQQGYDRGKAPGAETSGLGIFREIKPAVDGPVRPGDAIDVKLTVRNLTPKQLNDLAVIDLLPAGFEVVAGDLKSGPNAVAGTNFSELREDRTLFYLGLAGNKEWTVKYRMKAVCPGSFSVPSAMVEDMYDRGRHGISEPGRIEVVGAN
ncbi:alpha-2-macroglobulin [Luteolibacter sp. Populi]|uniref:alpha-2-macroglobulin family protein n=1 Tax=Luteolibacter sp. Populi TaxID=3230487 RepID=UPI003466811A